MKGILITAGIGLAVSSALGVFLAMADARADKFQALDKRHRACVASVTPGSRIDARPEALCEKLIAKHWAASVRAAACDQALSAKVEDVYGIRAGCSTAVMTLHAQRNAARSDLQEAQRDLKTERDGRAAAVARAAANATATAKRNARRETVDQTAPRDAAGDQQCDARCLWDRTRKGD